MNGSVAQWTVGLVTKNGQSIAPKDFDAGLDRIMEAAGISGFTVIEVQGAWEGQREPTRRIEVFFAAGEPQSTPPKAIAAMLRDRFEQSCVMLEVRRADVEFV